MLMRSAGVISVLMILGIADARAGAVQEQNKAVARAFFAQVLDTGRLDLYPRSHRSDFVAHGGNGRVASLAEDIEAAREERAALPDLRVRVDHIVAEGDLVSVAWTASGTHTGLGMGLSPTGRHVTCNGMTLFRFAGGKIAEEWSVFDMLSVLKQLGLYEAAKVTPN